MNRSLPILLCLALGIVAGCGQTRYVEVQGEAPPPTVITETDSVFVYSPPDTIFAPPDTVEVFRTVPVEVIKYLTPRPDTSRAFLLWHIGVDPLDKLITISGRDRDYRFRLPVDGEELSITSRSPILLEGRIEGEPSTPPAQTFECPAERPCTLRGGWLGTLLAIGALLGAALVGYVARGLTR